MKLSTAIAALIVAFALPASPAAAQSAAEPAQEKSGSFVESFEFLSDAKWVRSEGWRNGEHQSCTWSRAEAATMVGALELTIRKRPRNGTPYTCAEVQSAGRLGFGTYEARLKAARGSGVLSALYTYIGTTHGAPHHDGIEIAFLGRDTTKLQLNYYVGGQGGHETVIDLGFDAAEEFHTYGFTWTKDNIVWYVDGKVVHETPAGAAVPQLPGILFMTTWSGAESMIDWLGPFEFPQKRPIFSADWVTFQEEGDGLDESDLEHLRMGVGSWAGPRRQG
ncbi:family 16 glycosylhydrolase [Chthonobacter rhizosphaerae]|uniref:family 16 glycosylhydrolase n=1 Tax=Chthonobacter rhizosphaerae TaxID=2735553 RepID=UPI0015EF854F|nr:family 16 glycosylhydrolase [Chthonobacter rhizosphaerae]